MRLDIRIVIGAMFTVLGATLAVYGLVSDQAIYQRSLGINVNLWWGAVMLGFGVVMLLMGLRGMSRRRVTGENTEARLLEEAERRREIEEAGNRPAH